MNVHTSLRGFGAHKRDLLNALLRAYGRAEFLVRDAAALPGFSSGDFRRLVLDGLLLPAPGATPCRWRITSAVAAAAEGRAELGDVRDDNNAVIDEWP